ncbi:hypothetical protein C9374_004579 [Naegleria lovaniensis]|uniref:Uncharacterized protein n=1 Tax=Naegleria lovaniensis TaxID=51637 RepID=A0AA88GRY8_NAELO|nr:uncharacterized protein C9374_004579 [Naegleria lovaniensis]KAG2383242.1 hypothetical protein C9374_004579 [Naegleria lovaniensis]
MALHHSNVESSSSTCLLLKFTLNPSKKDEYSLTHPNIEMKQPSTHSTTTTTTTRNKAKKRTLDSTIVGSCQKLFHKNVMRRSSKDEDHNNNHLNTVMTNNVVSTGSSCSKLSLP